MPSYLLILSLLLTLVTSHQVNAGNPTKHGSSFNAADLMDPNLDDQMVDLVHRPDRGESTLKRIIRDIEQRDGKFAPRLYGYLNELGRIKQENQQHRAAIEDFQRMQTLTHWADGVFSPLQMESLRLQSRSYASLGKLRDADRIERLHLRVAEESFEDDSELVAPLWRLGDWQLSSLQYRAALKNYNRALEIAEQQHMDLAYKARTLKAKALTEHLAKRCCADETLKSVLQLSKHSKYIDAQTMRQAQLDAADMSVIQGRADALELYRQLDSVPAALLGPRSKDLVIQTLDATLDPFSDISGKEVIYIRKQGTVVFGPQPELISEFSNGDPVRLCAPNGQPFNEGFADVSLEISAQGKASNIKVSGTAPYELQRYLKLTLKKSAYRPAFNNGKAMASTLTFRQHFNQAKPLRSAAVADWRDILTEHACQFVAMR
tara:strand:+ start:818 stop:2119 length:1302 start_codon:yes stop_codon:yes gene_type:complete